MNLKEFVTKKIINPIKTMGKSSLSWRSKKSAAVVSLISLTGILSSLLLYIPAKIGIIEDRFAYAQQQQQQTVADSLSDSLQIAQSKVQAATSPGAWGHGVPSLYKISSQDLLMIFGISTAGCILAYFIIKIILNRNSKEKERSKMAVYQQP
jgi:hypothetical protein